DPWGGGPYAGAGGHALPGVRDRGELVLPGLADDEQPPMHEPLALLSAEGSLGFRATVVPLDDEGWPCVSKQCREALGVAAGDRVAVTPPPRGRGMGAVLPSPPPAAPPHQGGRLAAAAARGGGRRPA